MHLHTYLRLRGEGDELLANKNKNEPLHNPTSCYCFKRTWKTNKLFVRTTRHVCTCAEDSLGRPLRKRRLNITQKRQNWPRGAGCGRQVFWSISDRRRRSARSAIGSCVTRVSLRCQLSAASLVGRILSKRCKLTQKTCSADVTRGHSGQTERIKNDQPCLQDKLRLTVPH